MTRPFARLGTLALLTASPAWADEVRIAVVASSNEGLSIDVPLRYADDEGVRVADLLVEIGGFAPDAVERVPEATPDRVAEALGRAVLAASAAHERGDTVTLLVYYTGHAGTDGLHLGPEVLPLESLKTAARVVPADQRVFVIDACQSGQIFRSMGATLVDVGVDDLPFAPPPDEAWITSSGPEEQSFEVDGRRGALFTHFFVSGTRGAADADADGEVTLGEVFDFVAWQASAAAAGLGKVQRPRWGGSLEDLVIGHLGEARSGIDVVGPLAQALLVVDLDAERVVAEIPAGAHGRIALPPGHYQFVSLPSEKKPQVAETTLRSGDFEAIEVATRMTPVSGVRTRGGVLVARPWTLSAGYLAAFGQTPGNTLANGLSLGLRRELGRGHSLGLLVDAAAGGFTSDFVATSNRTSTAVLSWSLEEPVGRLRLGPIVGAGGGVLHQETSRTEHPQWGAWYGDPDTTVEDFAVATALGGLRLSVPFDTWRLELAPQFGGQAMFGTPVRIVPVASVRMGVAIGF